VGRGREEGRQERRDGGFGGIIGGI
jgi:hypothetical protein